MNKKIINILNWIVTLSLSLLGLFIVYQILRIIFGGSWSSENIIIAIVVMHVGLTISLGLNLSTSLKGTQQDLKSLQNSFSLLAADFKDHKKEFHDFKLDVSLKFAGIGHKLSKIESKLNE